MNWMKTLNSEIINNRDKSFKNPGHLRHLRMNSLACERKSNPMCVCG